MMMVIVMMMMIVMYDDMNIVNVTPFYNNYEDMRHNNKIKLYIEDDDDEI